MTNVESVSGNTGHGNFGFTANYYKSEVFESIIENADVENVGESIHLGIVPNFMVLGLNVYLIACRVLDENDNQFFVLENSCPNQIVQTTTNELISKEMLQVNYLAFVFSGM